MVNYTTKIDITMHVPEVTKKVVHSIQTMNSRIKIHYLEI
jgi:hypothetical protein